METIGLKPLDQTEANLWEAYKAAGVKFRVTDEWYNTHRRRLEKDPKMHHYEFDGFYDVCRYEKVDDAYKNLFDVPQPTTFNEEITQAKDQSSANWQVTAQKPKEAPLGRPLAFQKGLYQKDVFEGEMPDLRLKVTGTSTPELDTMGKLDDMEDKAHALEKELSIISDKIITFFYEANKTANEAAEATCQWNTLAGVKCRNNGDLIKKIGQRFDEKLAALRLSLSENRVTGILEDLEKQFKQAQSAARKAVEEIKKLA